MTDEDRSAAARAARRAYIRAAHPDRGGDPDAFVRGLAAFDGPASGPRTGRSDGRPGVHLSRRPDRVARRVLRDVRRRWTGVPPRNLR